MLQRATANLSHAEEATLATHLAKCSDCLDYQNQISALDRGLKRLKEDVNGNLTPDLSFRSQWQQSIRNLPRPQTDNLEILCIHRFKVFAWASLSSIWVLIIFFYGTAPSMPVISHGISPTQASLALKQLRQPISPTVTAITSENPHAREEPPASPRSDRERSEKIQWVLTQERHFQTDNFNFHFFPVTL